MNKTKLINVSNLKRSYTRGAENIQAISSVSFSIYSSEFVCVTGPSGSGKSTLLYILGLLDRQTGGEYYFNGRLTDKLLEQERSKIRNQEIGFVFQGFHLLPRADSLRNVAMPLEYAASHGKRLSKKNVADLSKAALERVGLADRQNHLPNQLSGGQRQRVAIARALVNNPSIILADEPTGNLDSKNGLQIMELFRSLIDEGRTIVMVTHNLEYVPFCTRHLMMRDGKLESDINVSSR